MWSRQLESSQDKGSGGEKRRRKREALRTDEG